MKNSECKFCKIVNLETDEEILYSNEHVVAVKDINPRAPIHILIISKIHLESFLNLRDIDLTTSIFEAAFNLIETYDLEKKDYTFGFHAGLLLSVNHLHGQLLAGMDGELSL